MRFNRKLYALFEGLPRPPRVLDLGCSGGGFIRDCLNDGCLAVGLEGSDFSLRMSRAEWALLANKFLFTADITKPFQLLANHDDGSKQPLRFDAITSWDVLEHIETKDLPEVCKNLTNNLADDGICIFSISDSSDTIRGVELHQTIQPKSWWRDMFSENGLVENPEIEAYFNTQFIRGIKQNAPYSFHIVLSKVGGRPPKAPTLTAGQRLLDAWYFSRLQKGLKKLVAEA